MLASSVTKRCGSLSVNISYLAWPASSTAAVGEQFVATLAIIVPFVFDLVQVDQSLGALLGRVLIIHFGTPLCCCLSLRGAGVVAGEADVL